MGSVLIWSMVLIGLLLVGFIAAATVKKRMVQTDDPGGAGFTLSQLRELHRAGKMSDEEFEKAKLVIVTAAKRATDREQAIKREEVIDSKKPPAGTNGSAT